MQRRFHPQGRRGHHAGRAAGLRPAWPSGPSHHRRLPARRRHRCAGACGGQSSRRCGTSRSSSRTRPAGRRAGGRLRRPAGERRHHAADGAHQQPRAGAQPAAQAELQRRARLHAHRAGRRHAQPADRQPNEGRARSRTSSRLQGRAGAGDFGSAGNGSAQHLALELFKLQAKVDAIHVPWGKGPLLTDLMGGQIQYSLRDHDCGHAAREERQGAGGWRRHAPRRQGPPQRADHGGAGFPASRPPPVRPGRPGKLPTAIAQKMNEDVNKVLPCPTCGEARHLRRRGRRGGTREKFAAFIRSETAKWAKGGEGRAHQGGRAEVAHRRWRPEPKSDPQDAAVATRRPRGGPSTYFHVRKVLVRMTALRCTTTPLFLLP